jgi:hypothetical protein
MRLMRYVLLKCSLMTGDASIRDHRRQEVWVLEDVRYSTK